MSHAAQILVGVAALFSIPIAIFAACVVIEAWERHQDRVTFQIAASLDDQLSPPAERRRLV